MGAQLDAVQTQVQLINTQLKAISDTKTLLDSYRTQRQMFADLVASTKTDLDALTTANTQALKDLSAAITAAFP